MFCFRPFSYQYQASSSSSSHGEVHHGPDTRTRGPDHLEEVRVGEDVEFLGGGAGGGATIMFRVSEEDSNNGKIMNSLKVRQNCREALFVTFQRFLLSLAFTSDGSISVTLSAPVVLLIQILRRLGGALSVPGE